MNRRGFVGTLVAAVVGLVTPKQKVSPSIGYNMHHKQAEFFKSESEPPLDRKVVHFDGGHLVFEGGLIVGAHYDYA